MSNYLKSARYFASLVTHGQFSEIERLELFRRYGFFGRHRNLFNEWCSYIQADKNHPNYTLDVLLKHAVNTVPYYRGYSASDLEEFPILSKIDLQQNTKNFVSSAYPPNSLRYFTTAGSTGIPFGFYYQPEIDTIRDAFFSAMWRQQGYQDYERSVVLRGLPVSKVNSRGIASQYDCLNNELSISTYDLSWEALANVVAHIRSFNPTTLKCYPSMGTLLSKYLAKTDDKLNLDRIFCGSENIYPWQIKLMEESLGGKVFSWYGHSENAALAAMTPDQSGYKVFSNYGIIELIDENGHAIQTPGVVGEIVATSLINWGMPFIRYRTADRAFWKIIPQHHEKGELSLIEGRLQELFVGKDKNIMSMTAINMHSPVFDHIKQFQFIQDAPGMLTMKIVPMDDAENVSIEQIDAALKEKTKDSIYYEYHFVDEIITPKNGKHKFLLQNIDINQYMDSRG